jgi:hypothetical protein
VYRLTLAEFNRMAKAHEQQERGRWYRAAWTVSRVIAPWVKTPVTPEDLLGWESQRGSGMTFEDKFATLWQAHRERCADE